MTTLVSILTSRWVDVFILGCLIIAQIVCYRLHVKSGFRYTLLIGLVSLTNVGYTVLVVWEVGLYINLFFLAGMLVLILVFASKTIGKGDEA